jgi:hypothetical protein
VDILTTYSARHAQSPDTFSLTLKQPDIAPVTRFIARTEELEKLHAILGQAEGRRTAVLQGLGGMGKTQLAIAYLRRHSTDYSATLWFNARDETTLRQSFARVADWILRQHSQFTYLKTAVESRDLDTITGAVKRWLEEQHNDRWLLVYDNYDDPDLSNREDGESEGVAVESESAASQSEMPTSKAFDIRPFFPESQHGAVLITTRSATVQLGDMVRLGKLRDVQDSLEILASTSHRQDLEKGRFLWCRRTEVALTIGLQIRPHAK